MGFTSEDARELADKLEQINSYPNILSHVKDESTRRRLREAGRKLSISMEAPGDTLHRIMKTPIQLSMAQVGIETHAFEILSQNDGTFLTCEELAQRANVDPVLMKRFLRYYESLGMVSQPSDTEYCANHITKALASKSGWSGINYFYKTVSPALMAFPEFLRQNGFMNPTDAAHCPWNFGRQNSKPFFQWIQEQPEHFNYFLSWMKVQRVGLPIFLDVMDFAQEFARGATDSTVLFVDIGGAMGHQSIALKNRIPQVPGRIILQEQASIISEVQTNPMPGFQGIETQVHDFFTPQPIKGARVYYLRNILHDWPSSKCRDILENIKPAMTRDSVILIDEMVLSERGVPWRAAQLDITMLACFAGLERSRADWKALLDDVGLRLVKIWQYTEECEDCAIVVALPCPEAVNNGTDHEE
ncbi:S-adenosyl-L-methionine-dependent methyltransferase [Xylaria flabelliformis]|nr:S-adenosyl-L-methionine-dependent methyltransferase [Xylaria flabelliformis]